MIRLLSTLVLFLLVQSVFAQKVYVNTGKNYTNFYSSKSDNPLLKASNKIYNPGNSYEIGMIFNKDSLKVAYSVGITFNEYNASYIIDGNAIRFDWQTQYVGIQNSLLYSIFPSGSKVNKLQIDTRLGINTALLTNGYENANGIHYQLADNEDYKKIILQPFVGLQISYPISNNCKLSTGYQLSIASLGKDTGNSFNYFNQTVNAGLSFKIN